jgi:DNA invertase Pin-like site-specific DNA recombinase
VEAGPAWPFPENLIETVNGLAARKIGFQSLRESMDMTTSGGKLIFHVFGALAEFERELIRERTQAGPSSFAIFAFLDGL